MMLTQQRATGLHGTTDRVGKGMAKGVLPIPLPRRAITPQASNQQHPSHYEEVMIRIR